MSSAIINVVKHKVGALKVGDLDPGLILTGAEPHPEEVYVKVKKYETYVGMDFKWSSGYCVLLNLSTGGLSGICRDEMVLVLEGEIKLHLAQAPRNHVNF